MDMEGDFLNKSVLVVFLLQLFFFLLVSLRGYLAQRGKKKVRKSVRDLYRLRLVIFTGCFRTILGSFSQFLRNCDNFESKKI